MSSIKEADLNNRHSMSFHPERLPRSPNPSIRNTPVSEFSVDAHQALESVPNQPYGFDWVANATRYPLKVLTISQSLSVNGFRDLRLWKHALLECWCMLTLMPGC